MDNSNNSYPKFKSASSPNLSESASQIQQQQNNPNNPLILTSFTYPKDSPSHIFFTSSSSTTTTSSSHFEPTPNSPQVESSSRPRVLTSPANPIEVLSGRKTPFYMPSNHSTPVNKSNTPNSHRDGRENPIGMGEGNEFWSPQSSSTRWTNNNSGEVNTPASSYLSKDRSNLNENNSNYQLGLSHLLQTSFDLNNQLTVLTGVVQGLTTKVAALEHDQQNQSDEILQLRLLLQSNQSFSPLNPRVLSHSQSSSQLPPSITNQSGPYGNMLSPSTSYSDLAQSRRSSNPFEMDNNMNNSSQINSPSSSLRYQFPTGLSSSSSGNLNGLGLGGMPFSIPNPPPLRSAHQTSVSPNPSPSKTRDYPQQQQQNSLDPSPPLDQMYSNNTSATYFDASPTMVDGLSLNNSPTGYIQKRRSRGSSEGLRARGLSITPVIAQAKWLSQQQNPGQLPIEPVNYRTLLEQDIDVDAEIFVRRILMQNDQQCSLYLQQRIKNASSEERRVPVYTAVRKHLFELSLNKFGNFLVSRCLEYGGLELTLEFTSVFVGNILQLSTDPFGCHVCQKLLDCGDQGTKDLVINELLPHIETLTQKNSGHVWSKLLATPNSPSFYKRLSEEGSGQWATIAKDETGSLVVQSVLENWKGAGESDIAKDCEEDLVGVALTQWGSFVVLHLIEYGTAAFATKALQYGERLALDHFGAKILEKALKRPNLPRAYISDLVKAICKSSQGGRPSLVDIASHATGSQLLAVLFSGNTTSTDEKIKMIQVIKQYINILKQTTHGEKICSFAERR